MLSPPSPPPPPSSFASSLSPTLLPALSHSCQEVNGRWQGKLPWPSFCRKVSLCEVQKESLCPANSPVVPKPIGWGKTKTKISVGLCLACNMALTRMNLFLIQESSPCSKRRNPKGTSTDPHANILKFKRRK